ncbi:MAG TPA: hypothetical protein DIU15_01230 [Deltaproteobacteria bacterium]|nr:hypothetical protein [Deltaproteobacteria bacterium]HCP44648.1 hypothetical protein [Deltaproteobacteria bacterium]|tara:strand:+ start:117 stop:713 length:597 start_codon:yes stop_codon:yes gene_type:complete
MTPRATVSLLNLFLMALGLPLLLSSCSDENVDVPEAPVVEAPTPVVEAAPSEPEPAPVEVEKAGPVPMSSQLQAFISSLTEEQQALANPLSGQAEAIKVGEEEYQSLCAQCHGKAGNAENAPAAKALGVTPPDFSSEHERARMTDGARFAAMKNGIPGTAMQAFGAAMSDKQIWQLLAYVETLAPVAPSAAPPVAPED